MNKTKIILTVLILFLLSACSTNTSQQDKYTGTEGVDIVFIENQPPNTIYDNTEIPISIKVTNNGAYDILDESNPIIISSNLKSSYYLEPVEEQSLQEREITLEGKRQSSRGEQTTMLLGQFTPANIDRTLQQDQEEIIIDACYPYTTTFSSTICAENSFRLTDTSICTPKETYRYRSQGAPIAVTEIKPLLTPQGTNEEGVTEFKPEYVITVQNKGRGTPTISENNKCDQPQQQNAVKVTATLNGNELDCQDNTIKLSDGEGDITCEVTGETPALRSNYQALLDVSATYDYTSSAIKELNIRPRQR